MAKNQNYSSLTLNALPRIDLRRTLEQIVEELMDSGSFDLVEIYRWDQANDEAVMLMETSRAYYIDHRGVDYALAEYPTTARTLTTGETTVVTADMDIPEVKWMSEFGMTAVLMVPLYRQGQVIGLAEIGGYDRTLLSRKRVIRACEEIIREASGWLSVPLKANSREDLSRLAKDLKRVSGAAGCSLSAWTSGDEHLNLVVDHVNAFWTRDNCPRYPMAEWTLARRALSETIPTIYVASDPEISPDIQADLEEVNALTKVMIPLRIGNQSIGFMDISDVSSERSFNEEELFAMGGIAGQVALAMQNAQLMDWAQDILEEQTTLRQSIEVFSSTVDRQAIQLALAERLCIGVHATSVCIYEFHSNRQSCRVEACYISSKASDKENRSSQGESYAFDDAKNFRLNLGDNQALQLHIDHPELSPGDRQLMENDDSKSRLYLSIHNRGKQIGFAEIRESRLVREFTQREIELCRSMCLQSAVVIENADLYTKAQAEIELRKKLEERLRHEALHDPLTKLPNRRLFIDRLEQSISRHSRYQDRGFAVLYFDLNKFKWINDTYGHLHGDQILIQVAECIRDFIRKSDTAARFGGDEFLVLLESTCSRQEVDRICAKIQSALQSEIHIDDKHFPISTSIGVAMCETEAKTADDYIARADSAMYAAKMATRSQDISD